jgi:glycosyltransferase involved in cell wall biosynthesis
MKIAIVAPTPIPFLVGGAEKLFWGLQSAINQLTPHDAELIKIPSRDQEFWPLMDAYYRFYHLDLSYFDRVITTKYPAWMMSHPVHDVYMQHTCRGVYDLYARCVDTERIPPHPSLKNLSKMLAVLSPDRSLVKPLFQELFTLKDRSDELPGLFDFPGPLTRGVIRFLDGIALAPGHIQQYFAISRNVADREGYFPAGVKARVIHHPTDIQGLHSRSHDYLFTASRMEDLKRIHLLIEAFKKVEADILFIVAGTGGQASKLRDLAGDDRRIQFAGFVSDAELIDYYAGALFVPFIPFDEDYGLITLEAMLSEKAVLTVHDAGGVTELVQNGVNGFIVEPNSDALANAMTRMIRNRKETIQMGKAALKSVQHITWENTVKQLLGHSLTESHPDGESAPRKKVRTARKKIVMVNSFSVSHPVSGGQKRVYSLCRSLANVADVTLVTFDGRGAIAVPCQVCAGAVEIHVPKSESQEEFEKILSKDLNASVDDIAAIDGYDKNSKYCEALQQAVRNADLVICEHPYLYRAVRHVWDGVIWLDAHNVEVDMKAAVLPPSPKRDAALDLVREVEGTCVRDAGLLICVSEEDKTRFQELYGKLPATVIVPNGMDFGSAQREREKYHHLTREILRERMGISSPLAVFMGSHHGPNNHALNDIYAMARQCPDIAFLVMGSVCDAAPQSSTPENIRLLGVLSESEKNVVLRAAQVALNPVVSGGGSNMKMAEYIAWNAPVLTTPFGVRGFDLSDGLHIWVRELIDFPEAIRRMTSPGSQIAMAEMADAAFRQASALYDWSVVCAPLLKHL